MEYLSYDNIVQFVILMVPGLFGYLVYRSFLANEEDDKDLQVIKVIAFAIPGYFLQDVLSRVLSEKLGVEDHLLLQFVFSSFGSVATGFLLGLITEIKYSPIDFLARLTGILKLKPKRYQSPSAIEYLDKEYFRNKARFKGYRKDLEICRIAKIYSLSSPEFFVINEVESWSREGEIILDKLIEFTPEEVEEITKNAICKFAVINVDAGMVMELTCIDKKITDAMFEKRYTAKVQN